MSRILISAAHKSSGKTTLSIGLCAALRQAGHIVQPFKKGPDYIDPIWLGQAAGRPCLNLDFYTQSLDEISRSFGTAMQGAELGLVEGNKGLYDGLDLAGSNSNAALARELAAPVVLVLDARGMTRGIAPLILGYQDFEPDINIAGIILNRVGGARHESKLRKIIEHYTNADVIGAVHNDPALEIVERHLGLIPGNEEHKAQERIQAIASRVADQVDLNEVMAIAGRAPEKTFPVAAPVASGRPVRIGIAHDQAFGFYYADDVQALKAAGAELVEFSPIHDQVLPDVDGLFLGGGFPETAAAELAANAVMREAIAAAIEGDMPVYAECGGLMYLTRGIQWQSQTYAMVGAIPADTIMESRPQGRGYVRMQETVSCPWPQTQPGKKIAAHEFHYSRLENLDESAIRFAFDIRRGFGVDGKRDGIVYRNVLASYVHLRSTDQYPWAPRFIEFVRQQAGS